MSMPQNLTQHQIRKFPRTSYKSYFNHSNIYIYILKTPKIYITLSGYHDNTMVNIYAASKVVIFLVQEYYWFCEFFLC